MHRQQFLPLPAAPFSASLRVVMRRECVRCEREVDAEYDEPKLRRWVKGYFWLGAPFIPLSPIIGADFVVMLPLTMLYVIGFGPALGVIREPPKCLECGAVVPRRAAA